MRCGDPFVRPDFVADKAAVRKTNHLNLIPLARNTPILWSQIFVSPLLTHGFWWVFDI